MTAEPFAIRASAACASIGTATLEGSCEHGAVLRACPTGDEERIAGSVYPGAVPHAARNDDRLSLSQGNHLLATLRIKDELQRARQEVHELIPCRVHLPVVPVRGHVRKGDEPAVVKLGAFAERLPEIIRHVDRGRAGTIFEVDVGAVEPECCC